MAGSAPLIITAAALLVSAPPQLAGVLQKPSAPPPFQVLLPIFAKVVLHGGPHTLGILTAGSGVSTCTAPRVRFQ